MTDPLLQDPRAALLAERAGCGPGSQRGIVAPDPMTYGSQAAAPARSFRAAARTWPCAIGTSSNSPRSRRLSPGSTTGHTAGALAVAARSLRSGSTRCLGGLLHRLPADSWRSVAEAAAAGADIGAERRRRRAARHDRGDPGGRGNPPRHCIRTPLCPSPARRASVPEGRVLQPIGAFKIRGAYVAVATLSAPNEPGASSPIRPANHAQGVARAARLLGIRPSSSCLPTRPPSRRPGSKQTVRRSWWSGRLARNARRSPNGSPPSAAWHHHSPYDDDRIIAGPGHGRARDRRGAAGRRGPPRPDRRRRAGSGVAVAIRALVPGALVIGVEPSWPPTHGSRCARADRALVAADASRTIADGPGRPRSADATSPTSRAFSMTS